MLFLDFCQSCTTVELELCLASTFTHLICVVGYHGLWNKITMPSTPVGGGSIKMMVPKSLAQKALKNALTQNIYSIH